MIIGTDLGTTNSAAAIWRDGAAQLVPNALGEVLTPSAVSIEKDGTTYVGAAALDRRSTHPKQTATNFKRLIGTPEERCRARMSLMEVALRMKNGAGKPLLRHF